MITKYEDYIKESLSTKSDIRKWLDSMNIYEYTINDDLTVDVDYDINISYKNLTEISVKFNKVNGDFYCDNNLLTSLEGCPNIVNDSFYCSNNEINSLKYCPTIINGNFYCANNNLSSLKYCPTIINGNFYCHNNPNLVDINDLDSKILIKNITRIKVSQELYDKYFEYWIDKDIDILSVLKNKVSDKIKQKYSHLFNAKNFDLI